MQYLTYLQVVISILLSIVILMQTPASTLNLSTMWNGMQGVTKKRWAEKFLFNATIILSVLFIANSTILFIFG